MAAAVLTLAACGNEEFIENNPGNEAAKPVPMTFTAGMPQTRTQLDGLNVNWSEGDQIALWAGAAPMQEFTATNINGSEATFEGTATPSTVYTAFYPLSAVIGKEGPSIVFNLPAEQTPVAGTFDNKLAPSLARATGGSTNLVFNNLCALVKFTAGADMAGEGTLTLVGGNATEALAGKLAYDYTDGALTATEPATRITLKGTFKAGQDYYFVVLPGALPNGFSLLYEDSEGWLYRKATSNSALLQPGRILNLGTLTGFELYISQAILPEGTGTPNGDGSVTLSELDLIALEEIKRLNLSNKGLTNLYGIEVYSNLKYLICNDNPGLTKIDVSKLTKLESLECDRNALTELKVTGLSNLQVLSCNKNKLTSLDLTGLTNLRTLSCSHNQLTSLDLTGLTSLEIFYCHENKLTELDISMLPALTTLMCGKQELPSSADFLHLYMTEEQYSGIWYNHNQGYPENVGATAYVK